MAKEHNDVRWNPELKEWFCAECGISSDHQAKEDAVNEMAAFECRIVGARASKLGEKERLLRAHYQAQQKRNK